MTIDYFRETDRLFFGTELDIQRTQRILDRSLKNMDDGELFLEYTHGENFLYEDGRLRNAGYRTNKGFGMRGVTGETVAYAHGDMLDEKSLQRAEETVCRAYDGYSGSVSVAPHLTNARHYGAMDPIESPDFAEKLGWLAEIDAYARACDPLVRQVSLSVNTEWRAIRILRANGWQAADIRPLVSLYVTVMVERNKRMERRGMGAGGRCALEKWCQKSHWQPVVDEAVRSAKVNLDAVPAPAGEMSVVLGSGWPGVLLHEAVGHGLEGDFNRKNISAFSGRMGEKIASPGVTVVDDGTLPDRRGSLTIDDEGTPAQRTVLIENGTLTGYLQDRQNAKLMDTRSTGNGRRQSYAHAPMPRMTNTFMLAGSHSRQEMIESVSNGLYAVNFGGGQVDITNGKFVFYCTEAYKIENGRVKQPVKGATLIGSGPDIMNRISMIGNDLELDDGIGTCGKDGQGVPVGVGQPSLRIDGITVGGTAA